MKFRTNGAFTDFKRWKMWEEVIPDEEAHQNPIVDGSFQVEWKRQIWNLQLLGQFFDLFNRANFGNNFSGNIHSSQFLQHTGFITPSGVVVPKSFRAEFGAEFRF